MARRKNDYEITELSIKTSYLDAFKFLTINGYGSQSRKLEELQKQISEDKSRLESKMAEDRDAIMKALKELQLKNERQAQTVIEVKDWLAGIDSVILELQRKHADITQDDLNAIKDPLEKAIGKLNDKMNLVISYLEKQGTFKRSQD